MSGLSTPVPPFSLTSQRYDTKTFEGRLHRNLEMVDPSTLFVSSAELAKKRQMLDDFKAGKRGQHTDAELWDARRVVEAIIHPDTGKEIPMPFRMSGYVPFGTPIVVGMCMPNPSIPQLAFWQWINQSHNAAVNYSNANASKPVATSTLLTGYFASCSVAVGLSIAITKAIGAVEKSGKVRGLGAIKLLVPFTAVAFANITNVTMMRRTELETGIAVTDAEGNVLGSSQAAAQKAIFETAVSRVVLPAPIFILPPVVVAAVARTGALVKRPWLGLLANAITSTLAFGGALPVALSLFPQDASLPVEEIEPEFSYLKDSKGNPIKTVYFNKGL